MNSLIKGVLLWVVVIFIIYLMFVFVTLKLDFRDWSHEARIIYIIISIFSSPFIIKILCILKHDTKKK